MAGTAAAFLDYDGEGHTLVITERALVSGDHGTIIPAQAWAPPCFFSYVYE